MLQFRTEGPPLNLVAAQSVAPHIENGPLLSGAARHTAPGRREPGFGVLLWQQASTGSAYAAAAAVQTTQPPISSPNSLSAHTEFDPEMGADEELLPGEVMEGSCGAGAVARQPSKCLAQPAGQVATAPARPGSLADFVGGQNRGSAATEDREQAVAARQSNAPQPFERFHTSSSSSHAIPSGPRSATQTAAPRTTGASGDVSTPVEKTQGSTPANDGAASAPDGSAPRAEGAIPVWCGTASLVFARGGAANSAEPSTKPTTPAPQKMNQGLSGQDVSGVGLSGLGLSGRDLPATVSGKDHAPDAATAIRGVTAGAGAANAGSPSIHPAGTPAVLGLTLPGAHGGGAASEHAITAATETLPAAFAVSAVPHAAGSMAEAQASQPIAHASGGSAGQAFEHMDSAAAPQMLESTPHRLAVGVQDNGLGWIEIRAHADAGRVSAVVAAGSSEAQSAISVHLPEVREYLAGQQVHVAQLSSEQFSASPRDGEGSRGRSADDAERANSASPVQVTPRSDFADEAGEESLTYINVRV
jgi:hypothetical protein